MGQQRWWRGVSRTGVGEGMTSLSLPREGVVIISVLEAKSMCIRDMSWGYGVSTQ